MIFPQNLRAPFWGVARWSQDHYVFDRCLLWTMNETQAPDDWLFTAKWDVGFAERLLAHGLFTIPDEPGIHPMIMLPNPISRYCLDLTQRPPLRRRFQQAKHMRHVTASAVSVDSKP